MKYPVFKLTILEDDNDQTCVDYVAIVDYPAIERNFQAFGKQAKHTFQATNTEKRIISGPLMVADLPIYRNDPKLGEYYVIFDKETIYKIVQKFARNNYFNNVNLMHDPEMKPEGVYMIESFLIDSARGISTPIGYDKLPEGSWFGSYKIDNDQLWDNFIKTGEFRGFSVEGLFQYEPMPDMEEERIKALEEAINAFYKELQSIEP